MSAVQASVSARLLARCSLVNSAERVRGAMDKKLVTTWKIWSRWAGSNRPPAYALRRQGRGTRKMT